MPVLIFVCDDEQLATDLEEAFFSATAERPLPNVWHEQRELRSIAASICTVLNIAPDASHLVQLLGGNAGMTNLLATTKWCKANAPHIEGDLAGAALIDALASRLHAYLTSKMH